MKDPKKPINGRLETIDGQVVAVITYQAGTARGVRTQKIRGRYKENTLAIRDKAQNKANQSIEKGSKK